MNKHKNKIFTLSECNKNDLIGEEILFENSRYEYDVVSSSKNTIVIEITKWVHQNLSKKAI